MVEGYLFFWGAWLLWGLITFFMAKNNRRTYLAIGILLCMISVRLYIVLSTYHIMLSFVILFAMLLFKYIKLTKSWLHMLTTFTVMIGYTGLSIWFISTPLGLFITEKWFVPSVMALFIYFLMPTLNHQLTMGIFGIVSGEIFYGLIAVHYHIDYTIGNLTFFDRLALIVLLLLGIDTLKRVYCWFVEISVLNVHIGSDYDNKLFKDC